MKERILEIMRQLFENDNIDESCVKENCEAWDSLHHLNLVIELEEEFNVEFEPEEIASMRSFSKILEIVESKLQ